jgi:hypothetical protein
MAVLLANLITFGAIAFSFVLQKLTQTRSNGNLIGSNGRTHPWI